MDDCVSREGSDGEIVKLWGSHRTAALKLGLFCFAGNVMEV